jgi:acyl-CoA reductase-like NAD-dependent aldehyde dehydrogenase
MKKYLIPTVAVLLVLAVAWIAFGQEQSERAERRARYREVQKKAIEVIQEQAAKLKPAFEEAVGRGEGFRNWRDLSEEERTKFREEWTKRMEEWGEMIHTIEQQLAKLKTPRQMRAEHEQSIDELKKIQEMAERENADQTAKHVEELIAKRNKEFEDTLEKLGVPRFRRSR